MEKIVQLSEYEYNQLVELAELNEKKIEKRAKQLYKEEGILYINIRTAIERDFRDEFVFKCKAVDGDSNNVFISYYDKREIIEKVRIYAEKLFMMNFGEYIRKMSDTHKIYVSAKKARRTFMIYTITGWLTSIIMIIYLALKNI